jgi:hypothetical protein
MNSSNIGGQNAEDNLTITSIAKELKEQEGSKADAWEGQFPSDEKEKEGGKRARAELDSSTSSATSPQVKVLRNNDDEKEKPTGNNGKNKGGGKKVVKDSNAKK